MPFQSDCSGTKKAVFVGTWLVARLQMEGSVTKHCLYLLASSPFHSLSRCTNLGINYFKTKAELFGCINDVKNVEVRLSYGKWSHGA